MEKTHTLLIAEDSAVQRVVLQRLLKRSGYHLLSAKDGLEGLALVRIHRPSLVISDITMPNMDGYALCQAIKQDPDLRHIPVLLLTGLDDSREVIHGLVAGADCYLTKPVDDPYLLEQIRFLLGLSEEERGAGGPEGMTVSFGGENYSIRAGRRQTMNLLLSTYENAVRKNRELVQAQTIVREKDALLIETIQAASRAKSEFIANLSHEIRTPMNAIMGFTDLALRAEPNPHIRDYLEKVEKASNTLMGCLNDILDFSKIEAGKMELYPEPFNLHDLFNNLADMFGDQAADKGLELVFSIPSDYFATLVGDTKRLQQVFINLLRNAVKFTDRGTVIVKAYPHTANSEPVSLHFSVQDTGIGIDAERINKLFNPFAQSDPSIAIRYGGSGLGLNICKRLIEMMGGQIWVESTLGVGSIFHFTVVLDCQSQTDTRWIVPNYLQDIRVLVVDDHDLTREVMEEMLRGLGLSPASTTSGESALAEILAAQTAGRPFDLIFMDWRMPGMDGIETTIMIRDRLSVLTPKTVQPKIVMLTAFGKATIQNFARNAGVDLFLHKPVTRTHLFNTILEVFGKGVPKQNPLEQVLTEESVVMARISGAQVLLVEDNPINQQVAQELLRRVGIVVEIANNGKEALCQLANPPIPDLVLMDVQMPEMDGYEATLHIRREARLAHLPIIAMTAHALTDAIEKTQSVGMNGYIAKPIDIRQLYATLIQWLNPQGDRAGLGEQGAADTSPTDASLLPDHMDGFDRAIILERFQGKLLFFKKMVLGITRYASTADAIQQAVAQREWGAARDMVHAMKGMAGSLAAMALYQAADALETAIDEGRMAQEPEVMVQFTTELQRVLETVRRLDAVPQPVGEAHEMVPADGSPNLADIASRVQTLSGYLRTRDTDAELGLADLRGVLPGERWQETLQQLEIQIEQLDYPTARITLERLAGDLGIVQTEGA
ncbi:MAG: response regulator [Magnetococcales bacterium]|nr:response regulator [Magnetococcales bacterium]